MNGPQRAAGCIRSQREKLLATFYRNLPDLTTDNYRNIETFVIISLKKKKQLSDYDFQEEPRPPALKW